MCGSLNGCMDETAFNYNSEANTDDGSCIAAVLGCTDQSAFNYNSDANTDDGSCYPIKYGCLDETAFNYNDYDLDGFSNPLSDIDSVNINTDNNSCLEIKYGCIDCTEDDGTPIANNCEPNISIANTLDESCDYYGCMDPTADNYNEVYNVPVPSLVL